MVKIRFVDAKFPFSSMLHKLGNSHETRDLLGFNLIFNINGGDAANISAHISISPDASQQLNNFQY